MRRPESVALAVTLAVTGCAHGTTRGVSSVPPVTIAVPRTILLRGERLDSAGVKLAAGNEDLVASFVTLLDSALAAYTAKPLVSRTAHDAAGFAKTAARVRVLGLAWYYTGDPRYSSAAGAHLREFFLDSAAVLSVVVDPRAVPDLVDGMRLLEGAPGWTDRDRAGMGAWAREYLDGLRQPAAETDHSALGATEAMALALFLGDNATARAMAEAGKVLMTSERPARLDLLTELAEMSTHVGVDLWHYESPDGVSLRKLLDAASLTGGAELLPAFRRGAAALSDPVSVAAIVRLPPKVRHADVSAFGYPGVP